MPGSLAAAVRDLGWRSSAGAPIIVEGRLWGVVAAASTTDRPLPPETEERIAKFAELVAAAIANAEGRAELTRLAEEQAAVRRVATLVAQGGSPAAVFEAVGAEIGPLVAADSAGVGRFENDGTVTALGGWARAGSYSVPAATRLAPERGSLAKLVFETGRPGRVDDYAEAPDGAAAVAREAGWRSSVGVPVFIEGRLWGLVAAASTTDRPLPADTEARLTEFTDVVASAIANAQGREEITRLAEKQAALRRVATRVAQGASPDEVFAAVAHEVAQVMQVPTVGVFRYDSDGATITAVGLWFALENASVENGCLWVIPGGHKLGLKSRFVRTENGGTRFEIFDDSPWPEEKLQPLEVETGTLIVLHGLLPHLSRENRSAKSRHAYTLHVIEASALYPASNWLQRSAEMPLRGFRGI